MSRPTEIVTAAYRNFRADSLYRNSIYLLLAALLNGAFSFIFWILAARLYTQFEVGEATALFAAVNLVAGFGTLGFNNSLIRFLPRTPDKTHFLNSAYTAVASAAALAGVVFLIVLPSVSPRLAFARHQLSYILMFLVFVISTATNTILDNNFTAYRATHYTLFKNLLINVLELGFLFLFLGLGAYGLFASYGVSFFLIVVIGFVILIRKFGYHPRFTIDLAVLRRVAKFSLANYVVSYLNGLPALVLPLVITNLLGARFNAVYFIAYNIASLLFLIPLGIGNALFAEGSHDELDLTPIIKRAIRITAILMVPGLILIIGLAPVLLFLFGQRYSHQGVPILRILAASGVFFAICYPCGSILNVLHRLRSLMLVNLFGAIAVIGIAYAFIQAGDGLQGVAVGWTIGWGVYAVLYLAAVTQALRARPSTTS